MVNLQGIDDGPAGKRKMNAGPSAFGRQHRQAEPLDAEPGQVTAVKEANESGDDGREHRGVGLGDAVNGGGRGEDGHAGVNPAASLRSPAVRVDAENGDFDDPVGLRIGPGGLDVQECQRACQSKIVEHE